MVKWETMWEGPDSQDVGLKQPSFKEGNSSLVESACAEDVTGLNHCTEAAAATLCVVG